MRTLLVTGRMRPLDRDALDSILRQRIGAGRERPTNPSAEAPATVVVATQCVEAGADYDVDTLVTECASLDALRQRFGRLNRLGEMRDARGVILVRSDQVAKDATDPIYGAALARTWEWLRALPEEARDFGIQTMAPVLKALEKQGESADAEAEASPELSTLVSPRASAPVMLPSHLNLWAQTKPSPVPDPDVSLWLHGIGEKQAPEVQVVWRADLSRAMLEAAKSNADVLDGLLARIELAAPVGLEALSLPIYAVRAWLEGEDGPDLADVEVDARSPKEREERWRDQGKTKGRPAVVWKGDESRVVYPNELSAGDTLVVPSLYGGLAPMEEGAKARGSWDPSCTEAVTDLGDRARFERTRRPTLRLHADVADNPAWAKWPSPPDVEDPDEADRDAVEASLAAIEAEGSNASPWLSEALPALTRRGARRAAVVRVEALFDGEKELAAGYLAVVARVAAAIRNKLDAGHNATTEGDAGSHTGVEVPLTAHLDGVADFAKRFAQKCGVSETVANSLEQAAAWHDIGKVDPRFQRLLRGGVEVSSGAVALAKGALPWSDKRARDRAVKRSGYPRGERHELASLALLRGEDQVFGHDVDVDLVKHLIASHHGHCRPFAPVVLNPGAEVDLTFAARGKALHASSNHGLERLDSEVPERFFRLQARYGWFGLAWLEAILRLADHRRSEREQTLAETEGAEQPTEERP